MRHALIALGLVAGALAPRAGAAGGLELRDGDRVVLVGNTLIERDQEYGYLETFLTARHPDRSLTFRNLGWSGDTVFGEARARFGTAEDGFAHLKEHVTALKPTVVLIGYGGNEAFAGKDGLPRFLQGLDRLLDVIDATEAREVVLLAPPPQEDLGRPLPDPSKHNADLRLYRDAMRTVAEERGYRFIDLFAAFSEDSDPDHPLTDDGLHFNAYGYWRLAQVIAEGLGIEPIPWETKLHVALLTVEDIGTRREAVVGPGSASFRWTDAMLPPPPAPAGAPKEAGWPGYHRIFKLTGPFEPSPDRERDIEVDGRTVARASYRDLAEGVRLTRGPEFEQVEQLRQAIREKNRLYFHRWRPQNETYLFGFRKHEQGNNAREVPLFDPLVSAKEAEIARLRVPVAHSYR